MSAGGYDAASARIYREGTIRVFFRLQQQSHMTGEDVTLHSQACLTWVWLTKEGLSGLSEGLALALL